MLSKSLSVKADAQAARESVTVALKRVWTLFNLMHLASVETAGRREDSIDLEELIEGTGELGAYLMGQAYHSVTDALDGCAEGGEAKR